MALQALPLPRIEKERRLWASGWPHSGRDGWRLQVDALAKVLENRQLPRVEIRLPALAFIATWLALDL